MRSWVRYSVSAYLGLLLAGSIASPGLQVPRLSEPMAAVTTPGAAPIHPSDFYPKPAVDRRPDRSRADS